jgi:hypothetical protein
METNKTNREKEKSSRKISQMPICLMARTFMTRHFLNGLLGVLFFLSFFHLYSSSLEDDGMMTMTTVEKQNTNEKKTGKEKRKKLFIGLGCFLMTLLTVFLCTHLEC